MEVWKDIPNYPKYEVSNQGNVRNKIRKQNLKHQKVSKRHYAGVTLYGGNGYSKKTHMVHLLVAEAFLPKKPNSDSQVNHLDGNKMNPEASNLEWTTAKENMAHAYTMGLKDNEYMAGVKHHAAKLTEENVRYIRRNYISGNKDNSLMLANKFNVTYDTIWRVGTNRSYKEVK